MLQPNQFLRLVPLVWSVGFGYKHLLSWTARLSIFARLPSRLISRTSCNNCGARCSNSHNDVASMRRENVELRQQANYWKAMHARAVHRADQLEAEVEQLRGENRKLKDQLFGRKSEKPSSSDRSNHLEGEPEDQPDFVPRKRGQRNDLSGPRRRDYSHLPVVEELHELARASTRLPPMRLSFLPDQYRGLRTSRNRCEGLSAVDPAATLSAAMPLSELSSNHHRSAAAKTDPQGIPGHFGVG